MEKSSRPAYRPRGYRRRRLRTSRFPDRRHRLADLDRGRPAADPAQIRHHQQGHHAAPQYTLRIKEWKTDASVAADAFTFTPPEREEARLQGTRTDRRSAGGHHHGSSEMTRTYQKLLQFAFAAAVGAGCLFVNESSLTEPRSLVSTADARIGRPLTPVSYAGVARRTTRRAVAVGAVAVRSWSRPSHRGRRACARCVQAVDAYGRVYARCY